MNESEKLSDWLRSKADRRYALGVYEESDIAPDLFRDAAAALDAAHAEIERLTAERNDARTILAGTDAGSLPSDWTLPMVAESRMLDVMVARDQVRNAQEALHFERLTGDHFEESADEWRERAEAAETLAAAMLAVVEAARRFRDEGTALTSCGRGPCQRVIEHQDNSDPQAQLFAALKALAALPAEAKADMTAMVATAKAAFEALPPEEQSAHRQAQQESWVRGEMGMGSDADEAKARAEAQEPCEVCGDTGTIKEHVTAPGERMVNVAVPCPRCQPKGGR